MNCLVRLECGSPESTITFQLVVEPGETKVVGRDPSCDLVVQDRYLSRRHFSLSATQAQIVLTEMGSRNGTTVNFEHVREVILAEGDVVRAGNSVFTILTIPGREISRAPQRSAPSRWGSANRSPVPEPPLSYPSDALRDEETRVMPPLRYARIEGQALSASTSSVAELPRTTAHRFRDDQRPAGQPELRVVSPPVPSATPGIPDGLGPYQLHPLENGDYCYSYLVKSGSRRTADLCGVLRSKYQIGLVVNEDQLDRHAAPLLGRLLSEGSAKRLSDTVLWLGSATSSEVIDRLAQSAIGLDATVLVGYRKPEQAIIRTLSDFRHLLCYPSLLFDAITRCGHQDSAVLFRNVVFLLFERDSTGYVYLFTEPGFQTFGTVSA